MKLNLKSITRYLVILCGAAGFLAMTACSKEEQPVDPPAAEETEEETEETPDLPVPPAPGVPPTPTE